MSTTLLTLYIHSHTVSPKRKYTHLSSQVLKTEGGQMKSRGCAKPPTELVQTGPSLILKFKEMAAYQNFYANCMEVNGDLWILRYFSREVASDFLFLCRHLLEFQNEAWPSLDQLTGGHGAPPTFPLASLDFEYLALPQVYTFFRGDCITLKWSHTNNSNACPFVLLFIPYCS